MRIERVRNWYWAIQGTIVIAVNFAIFAKICPALESLKATLHVSEGVPCWIIGLGASAILLVAVVAGDFGLRRRLRDKTAPK